MYDPSEPVRELRHVPIRENGDPLVDWVAPGRLLRDTDRFHYRREPYMRKGLYDRLVEGDAALQKKGLRLAILEGWRAPVIQRRMFKAVELRFRARYPHLDDAALREVVERFSAPMDLDVPPPHTTGGAVDLSLATPDGERLDLVSPFDPYDDLCFPFDAPGLDQATVDRRGLLAEVLVPTGLTVYASEYWHWSYGDQGWAYRGGHPEAHYAAVEPAGWSPAPEDDHDAPLEFIEDPSI